MIYNKIIFGYMPIQQIQPICHVIQQNQASKLISIIQNSQQNHYKQIVNALHAKFIQPLPYVHIVSQIENQQRKLKQIAEMKKNIAIFNSQFIWQQVAIKYDQISGTYIDNNILIGIHYQNSQQNLRNNKLKIGEVPINLAKLLNTKTYRINNQYSLEKCYDLNAKLKLSIDFTQVQQNYSNKIEKQYSENQRVSNHTSNWKVSKIRDKMIEDEKVLLQNKVSEYEQKIQRYREENNDHIKRLAQQIQKKQQKISNLISQNNTLIQTIQSNQIQSQKLKSRITNLQKQYLTVQQSLRIISSSKQTLNRQLSTKNQQIQQLSITNKQLQQTKDKKQQHYKQQLQKYMQKYMQSENARNRIIFQLQNKMKEEITKKQQYYGQIISKLQSKLQSTGHSSKQILMKKQKQLVILQEKFDKNQKDRIRIQSQCQQYRQTINQLNQTITNLSTQLQKCQHSLKSLESQSQLSAFSTSNLQREIQKLKSQQKILQKTIDQLKYQIQLANKTIQQQQATILKLNRNIKMHKQRQYYMEQKYQDQLEIKSYNQQCIAETSNYYKSMAQKMQIKIKFMDEKNQENQGNLQNLQRQKQKLQQQIKNVSRTLVQNSHQILRLQNQTKRLTQRLEEVQFQNNQKQLLNKDLQHRLNANIIQYQHQTNSYVATINELENKVRQLTQKMNENQFQWQSQFDIQMSEKNNTIIEMQKQVNRLKKIENQLREQIKLTQQRQNTVENQLHLEKDKTRIYEREALKKKFQITRLTDQRDSLTKQQSKYKIIVNQQKNQIFAVKNQNQKLSKKLIRQKQAYIELIKWILDRNWDSANRQFVQQANQQIQLQLISFINTGLERFYGSLQKITKALQQTKQQNEKILGKLNYHNLEIKYEQQFGKQQTLRINNSIQTLEAQIPWQTKIFQQKTFNPIFHQIPSDFMGSPDTARIQQLKYTISQLQKDLSSKISQIQTVNQQIFQQKTKNRELSQQVRNLKQDIQDLNLTISKKNSIIMNLQTQFTERQSDLPSYLPNNHSRQPPRANDYKIDAQNKFKQQKIIADFERKFEQLDRQNALQKSKIQLFQNKLKSSSQKNFYDSQKIVLLSKNLKQKEELSRNLAKDNQNKQSYLEKLRTQLEITNNKSTKKDRLIQELKTQVQQQRKIAEMLTKQIQDWQHKYTKRQRQLQKQLKQNQKIVLQTTQNLAAQKMEKQKLNLEQNSHIITLKSNLKQAQRRITSLQTLLQKSKRENQELHQKHLKILSDYSEAEENIKDMKMNELIAKQNYDKNLGQIVQNLQNKQFQLEEIKFSLQSKIMDLQKQLQERVDMSV